MTNNILIFLGPGIGHYHATFALASYLKNNGATIKYVVPVQDSSILTKRIISDGFDFIPMHYQSSKSMVNRFVNKLVKTTLRHLTHNVAKLPTEDHLPHFLSRLMFGISSYLRELEVISPRRTDFLERTLFEQKPNLVFVDYVLAEPFPFLCAKYNLKWLLITSSPVNVVTNKRPLYPAGFPPKLSQAEQFANNLLQKLRHIREKVIHQELLKRFPEEVIKDNFEPLKKISFSIREIDDYQQHPQSEYIYAGYFPYKLDFTICSKKTLQKKCKNIYISFGSTGTKHDLFLLRQLINIFTPHEYSVFLQIVDDKVLRRAKEIIPDGSTAQFHLVGAQPQPAYEIYLQADLVISHGGYNTVLESLFFGVPVLLIPEIVADRMEVAQRVFYNRYGCTVNYYKLKMGILEKYIHFLLHDDELQRRVKSVSEILQLTYQDASIYKEIDRILAGK